MKATAQFDPRRMVMALFRTLAPSAMGLARQSGSLAVFLLGVATTGAAVGQTSWTNAGTGNWNTASNWSLGVPSASSGTTFDAVIENGGTAQLMTTGASVRRLRVGRAAGAGTLSVDGGGLTVTENLYLNENGGAVSDMEVFDGATVTSPTTVVGYSGAGDALLEVFGVGSTYNATTDLTVGLSGSGINIVAIDSGGTLKIGGGSTPLHVATNPGSFGQADIGDGTLLASGVQFGSGSGVLQFFNDSNATFALPISGGGVVVKDSPGVMTLSGLNSYTGRTIIRGGTLAINADAELGTPPSSAVYNQLELNGGTLRATESFALALNRKIYVGASGGAILVDAGKTLTINIGVYPYTGSDPLTKKGAGKLNFAAAAFELDAGQTMIVHEGEVDTQNIALAFNNPGTATLAVDNGALLRSGSASFGSSPGCVGNASVLGTGSAWLIGGDLLLGVPFGLDAANKGSLTVADGGAVSVNSGTGAVTMYNGSSINIGVGGAPGVFSAGSITSNGFFACSVNFNHNGPLNFGVPMIGNVFVNQSGSGTTTLSGTQNYIGPTTVSAGTLAVAGNLAASPIVVNGVLLVTGSVGGTTTVNNGGTVGGTGTTAAVTVHSGGVLSPGMSVGTLSTGSLTLEVGSTSRFELKTPGVVGGGVNDLVAVTGDLVFGGTLAITALPGFGAGTYPLFTYTSIGVNQGLAFESSFLAAHPGSTISIDTLNKRVVANITASMPPGDFNGDGHVNAADIPAMLMALADLQSYKSTHALTDTALLAIGDLDGSGAVTNADLQALLNVLKSGGGSVTAVPESATLMPLALAFPALARTVRRRRA